MRQGINAAKWNDVIDWIAVKAAGIAFAILKATNKENAIEDAFETNYDGCVENGIDVGIYRYVYAQNEDEAQIEANALVKALEGKKIPYGAWLHVEDDSIRCLEREKLAKIIEIEATILRAAGLIVGIFCTDEWLKNVLPASIFRSNYPLWIARHGTNDGTLQQEYSVEGIAVAWQYTTKGMVSGIQGEVSRSVCFTNIPIAPPSSLSYELGQRVSFSSFYKGAFEGITDVQLLKKETNGLITAVMEGKRNPYQIDGRRCYLNEGDIRSVKPGEESRQVYHVVKEGQNLTVISKIYETPIQEILRLNPSIINKNSISTGIEIRVK